jgi:hypothetical protein
MDQPQAPALRDFDLSEEALRNVPRPRLTSDDTKVWFTPAAIVAQWIASWALTHNWFLVILWTFMPVWALVAGGLQFVLERLEERHLAHTYPDYSRAARFKAAVKRFEIDTRNYQEWLERRKKDFWLSLPGERFEVELARLFRQVGYDVTMTPVTGDGGVDLLLKKDGSLTIVQCKAQVAPVAINVARELRACLTDFRADAAIIACTHGVTKPVREYIRGKPMTVLDVDAILRLQKSIDR